MTREEAIAQAKENLYVAAAIQRRAEKFLDDRIDGLLRGEHFMSPKDRAKVAEELACAYAHRESAVDYLSGDYTPSGG